MDRKLISIMGDKPKPSAQAAQVHATRQLVREGHAMRNIVRNMVVNMECVLSDLQGIMGEIQSLVVQIDSVTDKIDKQCGPGEKHSQGSQHSVRKPQCLHASPMLSEGVYNPLYSHGGCESSSQQISKPPYTPVFEKGERQKSQSNVEHWLLRGASAQSSCKDHFRRRCGNEFHDRSRTGVRDTFSGSKKDKRRITSSISNSSKGFATSPSGGIAVVYPTIVCSPDTETRDTTGIEVDQDDKHVPVISNFPLQATSKDLTIGCATGRSNTSVRTYEIPVVAKIKSTKEVKHNEAAKSKASSSKLKQHAITSVYNKSFQPVTPTEQKSPDNRNTRSNVCKTSKTESQLHIKKSNLPVSSLTSITQHGGSLPNSPRLRRVPSAVSNQRSIPNSPYSKRSAKHIYSYIDGSSTASRSPVPVHRPVAHHYYHSIESDLDSEAANEMPDIRSMTPDMDWSYLNLVGNQNRQDDIASRLQGMSSINAYGPPIESARVPHTFHMLQKSPDVVGRLPVFLLNTFSTAEQYSKKETRLMPNEYSILETLYDSPVVTHIFCSEVSSVESGGYCGCYEAVVDSVLENVAGFETFEEACRSLDDGEALIETYVSFDEEFEEDDWDIGLKPDNEDYELDLPSLNIEDFFDNDDFLGSLDRLHETSKNMLAVAVEPDQLKDIESSSGLREKNDEHLIDNVPRRSSKRRLSPSPRDDNMYDDMDFRGHNRHSFTEDDICAMKPSVSGATQNFTLWPKPFSLCEPSDSNDENKSNSISELETNMTSSDDASCQAVGSGSPMSFSSPEAAFTSPDTDRFLTSSECDDLILSSDTFPGSQDNLNATNQKTNMRQLRREFFDSLYSVCEKNKEAEKGPLSIETTDITSRTDHGFSRIDNSRDNLSDIGSYHEDMSSYNRNVNTWTAYAMVHVQADDVSDSASDIINDNLSCSMTSSYLDADNIGSFSGNQSVSF